MHSKNINVFTVEFHQANGATFRVISTYSYVYDSHSHNYAPFPWIFIDTYVFVCEVLACDVRACDGIPYRCVYLSVRARTHTHTYRINASLILFVALISRMSTHDFHYNPILINAIFHYFMKWSNLNMTGWKRWKITPKHGNMLLPQPPKYHSQSKWVSTTAMPNLFVIGWVS